MIYLCSYFSLVFIDSFMLLFVNVQCCPFAVVLLLLYFMPVYALCNFVKKGAIQIKFIIIIIIIVEITDRSALTTGPGHSEPQ